MRRIPSASLLSQYELHRVALLLSTYGVESVGELPERERQIVAGIVAMARARRGRAPRQRVAAHLPPIKLKGAS